MYVYRRRDDGTYEVGFSRIAETLRRPNTKDWVDSRICETWSEENAVLIAKALNDQ